MDFNTFANSGIYANMQVAIKVSKNGEMKVQNRSEFLEEAWQAWQAAADKRAEDKLYAGSETRTVLSDAEIAVLRNKYDPRNMSGEEYDAFLDDLADMGVISQEEKRRMGYKGLVIVSYLDENGETVIADPAINWMTVVPAGSENPAFHPWEADGDILKWASGRLSLWKPVGGAEAQQKAQRRELEIFQTLSGILSRMAETQADAGETDGAADKDEEPSIIDQIRDPDSAFYQNMYHRMRLQLELSEEEKKEQAIIDTLGAILDGMRSTDGAVKRKNMASSVAGLSKQISELDEEDPRKMELDLLRQRLNQLGIFVDLDLGVKDDKDGGWQTLTERLISEENQALDPSIFDLI